MPSVRLDGREIRDWRAFHAQCKTAFGFPDFYGQNMDAWIDCLSGLRDDDRMSSIRLDPDQVLEICVLHSNSLRQSAPGILAALEDCVAEVNQRYVEHGEKPALALLLR